MVNDVYKTCEDRGQDQDQILPLLYLVHFQGHAYFNSICSLRSNESVQSC